MRTMRAGYTLVVASVIALASATNAHAAGETERAGALFKQAQEAFAHKSYAAAAGSFEEAARLAPHAAAWLDAGEAWELDGSLVKAAEDCDRALAVPDISNGLKREAEGRLARLTRQLGAIDVRSAETIAVTIDGGAEASAPTKRRVLPGKHALAVIDRAGGKARTLDIDVPRGETVVIDLALMAIATPAAPVTQTVTPAPTTVAPSAPPTRGSHGPPVVTYVAFGAAGAAAIAAVAFGASTLSAKSDFTNGPTPASRDHFYTTRTITNVSWAIAGVAASVGALVWIFSPFRPAPESRSALGIFVRDGGIAVAHETRF